MTTALEPMEVVAWLEGVLARGPLTFQELNALVDRRAIASAVQVAAMTYLSCDATRWGRDDQLATAVDIDGRKYVGRRDHLTPALGFRERAVAVRFVDIGGNDGDTGR